MKNKNKVVRVGKGSSRFKIQNRGGNQELGCVDSARRCIVGCVCRGGWLESAAGHCRRAK